MSQVLSTAWFILFSRVVLPFCTAAFSDCPTLLKSCLLYRPVYSYIPAICKNFQSVVALQITEIHCVQNLAPHHPSLGWSSPAPSPVLLLLWGMYRHIPIVRTTVCCHPWMILPSHPLLLPIESLADFCQFCVLNLFYIHQIFFLSGHTMTVYTTNLLSPDYNCCLLTSLTDSILAFLPLLSPYLFSLIIQNDLPKTSSDHITPFAPTLQRTPITIRIKPKPCDQAHVVLSDVALLIPLGQGSAVCGLQARSGLLPSFEWPMS